MPLYPLQQPLRAPLLPLRHRPGTGKSFDHRKQWIADRLEQLSAIFSVDVCCYALLTSHSQCLALSSSNLQCFQ
jgi:hypothetical protein